MYFIYPCNKNRDKYKYPQSDKGTCRQLEQTNTQPHMYIGIGYEQNTPGKRAGRVYVCVCVCVCVYIYMCVCARVYRPHPGIKMTSGPFWGTGHTQTLKLLENHSCPDQLPSMQFGRFKH